MDIYHRSQIEVNTDPQRRCYDGCHYSSEWRWTEWELLEIDIPEENIDRRLQFWRELNDYAVSQRGKGARKEFESRT
jgi:hypothetical protein